MGQELIRNVMKVALSTFALFLACLLSDLTYNLIFLREINVWVSLKEVYLYTFEILSEPFFDVMRNYHHLLRESYMIKVFVLCIGLSCLLFILKRYFSVSEDPLKSKYLVFLFIFIHFWGLYGRFELITRL